MEMFQFQGFSPSAPLRLKANRLLAKVQEEAPSYARASAELCWDGERYRCSIRIESQLYPVSVSTSHWNAGIALDKAEFALARRLERRGVAFSAVSREALPSEPPRAEEAS